MTATIQKPLPSTAPARQGSSNTEALPPSIRNRLAQAGLTTAPGAKPIAKPR